MNADQEVGGPGRSRADALLSAALGAGVFLLYLQTLLPHLGGTEDTPKFQYLGAVLGTAHSPGYPLYILVSHLVSLLPFGTLAYRINLLSAVLGAATVALTFLMARRLGVHRLVAASSAVALAAGRLFWANSIIAEVYTLNTVLWAAAMLKLVDWNDAGRDRDLYWATAFVALGLGNHLTILAIGPAALALLVLSGRRWFSPRRVLICLGILAAGLAQYGFIWIRTLQGASYLESRATSLSELVAVMTARRYRDLMFSLDLRTLLTERLPDLIGLLRAEVGLVGLGAALVGTAVLVWRRPAPAALLILSVFGMVALTANVTGDAGGFLLPAFLMMWALAAAGLEAARQAATRRAGAAGALAVVAAVCLLPAAQVYGNYTSNDKHDQTFETDYFKALFTQLPADSALAIESYWPEHMIRYAIVSNDFQRVAPPPLLIRADPGAVAALLDRGTSVFAFPDAIGPLRAQGFVLTPDQLRGPALADYVAGLGPDLVVVAAARGVAIPERVAQSLAGRIARWTGRLPASATDDGAVVAVDGEELVHVEAGIALAAFDADGGLVDVQRFVPEEGFTSALPMRDWPLARVTRGVECTAVGDSAWHDVTRLSRGTVLDVRLDNREPFDAETIVYAIAEAPLRPELTNFHPGCHDPTAPCPPIARPVVQVETWIVETLADRERVLARAVADGLDVNGLVSIGQHVSRVRVVVNDRGQFALFAVRLNGLPARVLARVRPDDVDPRRGSICELPIPGLFDEGQTRRRVDMRGDPFVAFGAGWHMAEAEGEETFRWTAATDARLVVPVHRSGAVRIAFEGRGLDLPGTPQTLALSVNGILSDPRPLGPGWAAYEWTVPADGWRLGVNEVVIHVSRVERPSALGVSGDSRPLGAAIRRLRITLVAPAAP